MDRNQLLNIIKKQDDFFLSSATKDFTFRMAMLKKFQLVIEQRETAILEAIKKDLHKPETESYVTELAPVLTEIQYLLKNLKKWMKPARVRLPSGFFPSRGVVAREPFGRVLIIGPWNYPFQLLMLPLAGALAAGNCVFIKPPELAPHTSRIMAELITDTFDPRYIAAAEGDTETGKMLLTEKWDFIFFTGGSPTGKSIMEAAAKHLTPVTLELGGKSPCIIDSGINLEVAARRIAWGKFINAGQICIAPDYLYINKDFKNAFLECLKKWIEILYSGNAEQSTDYGRIINNKHLERIIRLMDPQKIRYGGLYNRETLYISPTILDNVTWKDPVMQEEIFGPVLPVMEYTTVDEVIDAVNHQPQPLSLYIFSKNKKLVNHIIKHTHSGSVCVNDVLFQIMPKQLPMGGLGSSGMGNYHGRYSFETFSHKRSILQRSYHPDIPQRYPPYKAPLKFFKAISKFMF